MDRHLIERQPPWCGLHGGGWSRRVERERGGRVVWDICRPRIAADGGWRVAVPLEQMKREGGRGYAARQLRGARAEMRLHADALSQ